MSALITITSIDEEPRVLDTDLAEALGFALAANIRDLIARNSAERSGYIHRGASTTRWRASLVAMLSALLPHLSGTGGMKVA